MKPTHERNVRGMHAAPRCEARTKAGGLCLSPAVQDKTRCHVHGGKGSKAPSYAQRFGDYTKANIERDRQITLATRLLDKLIRNAAMGGHAIDLVAPARDIRRLLITANQQSEARLKDAYAPSAADREAARQASRRLEHARRYDKEGVGSRERVRDRALGTIIGLAVGEAVGLAMEGNSRNSCAGYDDMEGGGWFELERGQWAGDTAMALALMQSLEFRGHFDQTDFMDRLVEWEFEGKYSCTGRCVGISQVTSDALGEYRRLGNPVAGDEDPDCLDSGSLVRVGPVAARYWRERSQLHKVAASQSETTHANIYAIEICVGFADILADAIAGQSRDVVLRNRRAIGAESAEYLKTGSWKHLRREDVRSTNNVLGLLEAALWCVYRSESFEEAVLRAARLGHDAGTVAALTGQLAGALYGASGIPESWTEDLAWYDQIVDWAEPLLDKAL